MADLLDAVRWLVVQPPPQGWQVFGVFEAGPGDAGALEAMRQAAEQHGFRGSLAALPAGGHVARGRARPAPQDTPTIEVVPE